MIGAKNVVVSHNGCALSPFGSIYLLFFVLNNINLKADVIFFFLKALFQQGSSFFKGKRLIKDFIGKIGMFFALSLALGAC